MSEANSVSPAKFSSAPAALLDLAALFVVTAGAYLVETWAHRSGLLAWPEATNGLLTVAAGVALVVFLVAVRGPSWRDIGFRRPKRFWTLPLWALAAMVVFLAVQNGSVLALSQIVDVPRPELSRYDFLHRNVAALVMMLAVVWATASLPEELIYRGFVFDRLQRILGIGPAATVGMVLLQAVFFGAVHFHAGLGGMLITAVMGLVWGVMYVLTGRNLWPLILAHYLTDAAGVIGLFLVQGSTIGAP